MRPLDAYRKVMSGSIEFCLHLQIKYIKKAELNNPASCGSSLDAVVLLDLNPKVIYIVGEPS